MLTAVASPADRLVTLPAGEPALTLGYQAAMWAEEWLVQPNGPRAGQPFELTDGQLKFLAWWYAVDDEGRWLFHHGVRRLAKGSGKSPFAAVLALIEFCGPVRLDDFDPRLPGGCIGRPFDMPLVQIAATAESQTGNTMRMVRAFAPRGSRLVEAYQLDPGKVKYYRLPEGTLEVITSSATAAEGAESSMVVADETEHWRPSNGGVELASTLQDNLAKSGSRMLETSNAWIPGVESVAEGTWEAWVAQEEGRTRADTRILYDARIAPADTRLDDEASLLAALRHVYADCPWQDLRPIMNRIWSVNSRPDDSRRKYLNRPTAAVDAWTTPEAWSQLADPEKVVDAREPIAMFFDGSKSRDATALVGCRISDGHVFLIDAWEPDPAHNTMSVVPVAAVDLAVRAAIVRWDVVGFFGDVQEWESYVTTEWPELLAGKNQLAVQAVPSGREPRAVAWDMRSHVFEFTKACELVLAEIAEQKFTHDGSAVLARHIANARNRPNRYGVSIGKESPDSPRKIDAAVCVIGARMVRRLVLASPAWAKRKKKTGRAAF